MTAALSDVSYRMKDLSWLSMQLTMSTKGIHVGVFLCLHHAATSDGIGRPLVTAGMGCVGEAEEMVRHEKTDSTLSAVLA